MLKLLMCGDSILRGVVWSSEAGKYTTSKAIGVSDIAQQVEIDIENRSHFGYTIENGAKQLFSRLEKGQACDIALLEFGGNDCDFNWQEVSDAPDAEHLPHIPIDEYERKYRDTIRQLKKRGIISVLCNLVPVCSGRYLSWISRGGLSKSNILSWLGDEHAIYRYQERYSRKVEQIAREEGCPLIDLRGSFLSQRQMEPFFCPDGIHPNEKGQALIHQSFLFGMLEVKKSLLSQHS